MQREEKQLDSALEALIMRVNNLKSVIAAMIFKIENEYETLNWSNCLDNFALISGHVRQRFLLNNSNLWKQLEISQVFHNKYVLQLTSLSKILSHDKAPNLRSYTVLPLHLSPEKDDELLRMIEGRISTFAHDLVPDYLRTKPDPSVEQKMLSYEAKVANLTCDATHVSKIIVFIKFVVITMLHCCIQTYH